VVGAVLGGMDPQQAVVAGGGALLADSNDYPWNGRFIVASGNLLADFRANAAEAQGRLQTARLYNMTDDPGVKAMLKFNLARDTLHQNLWLKAIEELQADGLETTVAPNALFDEEYPEHATSVWHLSDGSAGQTGGWAFVVSVAYVDPGNFATNMSGGASYGYTLLWVIAVANLVAMFVQALSANLGIATDLAEFLGGAMALNLLFGVPLLPAAGVTAVVSAGLLALAPHGRRRFETVITGLLAVICAGFVYQAVLSPHLSRAAAGLVPHLAGRGSLVTMAPAFALLAAGADPVRLLICRPCSFRSSC
jgi:hypothetical protein